MVCLMLRIMNLIFVLMRMKIISIDWYQHVRYADDDDDIEQKGMPSTVLISLRPIKQGEELFSCYLNVIQEEKR